MATAQKTLPTPADVDAFISSIENDVRREDARTLKVMMERVTGEPATMWGPSIVGFGAYHYVYPTGNEGDAAAAGFSPRKAATTVYVAEGFAGHAERLARLGPHTTSVSCLYIKRLSAVDLGVLEEIVAESYRTVTEEWSTER